MTDTSDIVYRLEKRAEIRRSIATRKSVQEGQPDRIADLLEEAAREIKKLRSTEIAAWECLVDDCEGDTIYMRANTVLGGEEGEGEMEISAPRSKFDGIDLCNGLILRLSVWSDERTTFA
ncbi:MAG: hypothetical protein EOO77_22420, partial [Oxalobacteraceae bacterium]